MATESIEVWVQSGIPENNEAIFNAHIRSTQGFEWEVSHPLSKFSLLDRDINALVDTIRDIPFPSLSPKTMAAIASRKHKEYSGDLEKCRILLEKWIYGVISRMELYPPEVAEIVEDFFLLPCGPIGAGDDEFFMSKENNAMDASDVGSGGGGPISRGGSSKGDLSLGSYPDTGGSISPSENQDDAYTIYSGETESVGGTKRPKRKRILKGMKRRFEKLTGKQQLVEEAKTTTKQDEVVQEQIKRGQLLKVRVVRGAVGKNNEVEYETQIIYDSGSSPLTSEHTYNDFKSLNDALMAVYAKDKSYFAACVSSEFPRPHNSLMGMTEAQLSERSRMLDTWFRDLCSSYRSLRDNERALVRQFILLSMIDPVEIAIQDRLALGLVEANRSEVTGDLSEAANALIASKPSAYETKSEGGRRRASLLAHNVSDSKSDNDMLARNSVVQGSLLSTKLSTETRLPNKAIRRASSYEHQSTTSPPPGSNGTPLMRAGSTGSSLNGNGTSKRRTSYVVSVPNNDVPQWSPHQAASTKHLPPIEDRSVTSVDNSITEDNRPVRDMVISDAIPRIDGAEAFSASDDNNLEEKLLKIGMSDRKSKKRGCCIIC